MSGNTYSVTWYTFINDLRNEGDNTSLALSSLCYSVCYAIINFSLSKKNPIVLVLKPGMWSLSIRRSGLVEVEVVNMKIIPKATPNLFHYSRSLLFQAIMSVKV